MDNILTAPTLKSDIPNDRWLDNKKQDSISQGVNERTGAFNSFGTITGYFADQEPVMVPVAILKTLKGLRDEQNHVRQDDLTWLMNCMKEGELPKRTNGEDYCPFIQVDQDGNAWVNEGNHRIMSADRLDWQWMKTEIRYFNGGECVPGPLSPDKIMVWHEQYVQDQVEDQALTLS